MGDITIVYSGGVQNTKQGESLGGFPSPVEVGDEKNNLYSNVTSRQSTQGSTDYRCFYVFNDGDKAKYDVTLFIEYLNEIGSSIDLGMLLQNEIQRVAFSGGPTGGQFRLSIQGVLTDWIVWNSDGTALAAAIQNAITDKVTTCTVTNPTTDTFNITFTGDYKNKAISLISVIKSSLTPSGVDAQVTRLQSGSPINTIAPDTGNALIIPTGVPFFQPLNPGVNVGTISPAEGFPVWVKRTVAAGFGAVDKDGFTLKLKTVGTLV